MELNDYKMKKEELPRDDSALAAMTRELMYVKDKDGQNNLISSY